MQVYKIIFKENYVNEIGVKGRDKK